MCDYCDYDACDLPCEPFEVNDETADAKVTLNIHDRCFEIFAKSIDAFQFDWFRVHINNCPMSGRPLDEDD